MFNQIRKLYVTIDAVDNATSTLRRVDQVADNVGESMGTAAGRANFFAHRLQAVAFGAAAVVGALATMVNHVSKTTRVFGRIKGVTGATAQQMDAIRQKATKIGAVMPVTMMESARAFEELAYAGFNVRQSIAASHDVVMLAIAGNIKMSMAANTAARALNSYGLKAKEIAVVTQSLAAAATTSALNMKELAKSLEYVMPVAAAAGQTIAETTAALGVLADTGLAGSKAGTSMQRLFIELAKLDSSGKEALQSLGLTVDNFTNKFGQFKDLYKIIGILKRRMQGLSGVKKMQLLQKLFGARGYRAAQKLLENYNAYIKKIGDNVRAQVNATLQSLDKLSNKELQSISQTFGFKVTGDSSPREVIAGLNKAAEDMTQTELALKIQTEFTGIGKQGAEIFARDLKADVSVDKLTESITSMTTAASIAEAQMETLWGQIEYVKGSIDSLVHGIVRGAMPGLMLFFGAVKLVLDVLNGIPGLAEGIGVAMLALTGILTLLAAEYGALYLWTTLTSEAMTAYVGRTVVASRVASGLTGAVNAVSAAQSRLVKLVTLANAKTAANTVITKTNAIASAVLGGAKKVLSIETWRSAAATARDTASKIANRIATTSLTASTVSGTLALWASTAAKYASATASLVAAGAMWSLNAAIEWFESMTLVGQILSIVVGLALLAGTLATLTDFDIGGWIGGIIDWFDGLGDAIGQLIWYLKAVYAVFAYLGELGIAATLGAIGDAFAWVGQRIQDFTTWLTELPIVGDALVAVFNAINFVLALFNDRSNASAREAGFLSNTISNLGLAIGSVLRLILALVGPVIDAWNWFTETVNNVIGAIATLIGDKLRALERILSAAYSWVEPLVSAVSGVLIPILESLGWVIDLVVGNLDLIAVGLGVLFGPLSLVAGLVYALITRFGQITDTVGGFVDYIINDLPIISNIIQFIIGTFAEFFTNLGRVFGALWSIIGSVIDILANLWVILKLGKILVDVFLLATAFAVLKAAVMAVVGVFEWLYGVLEPILAPIIAVATAILDVLMPAFELLWDIAKILIPVFVAVGAAIALIGSGPIGVAIGAFVALVAVVKVLAVALGLLADVLEWIASGLSGFASFLGNITGAMVDAIVALLTSPAKVVNAAAQMGVSLVVGFINGVASMLAGIGSFIAELFGFGGGDTAKKSGFSLGIDLVTGIAKGILFGPLMIVESVLKLLGIVDNSFSVINIMADIGVSIVRGIVEGILSVPGIIASAIGSIIGEAVAFVSSYIPDIPVDAILAPLTGLASMLSGVFGFVGGVVDNILVPFQILGDVLAWVSGLFADAARVFGGLPGPLKALAGPLRFVSDLFNLFSKGAKIPITIAKGIASVPSKIVDAFVDIANDLLPFLPGSDAEKGPLSNLTRAGMGLIKAIASGILSVPGDLIGAVVGVLGGIGGAVVNAAKNIGGMIAGGISAGLKGAAGLVKGAVGWVTDTAKGIVETGADIVTAPIDMAKKAAGKAKSFVGGLIEGGKDLVGGAIDKVKSTAGGILDASGVPELVNKAISNVKPKVRKLLDSEKWSKLTKVFPKLKKIKPRLQEMVNLTPPKQVQPAAIGGTTNHITVENTDNRTWHSPVNFHGEVHDVKQVDDKIKRRNEQTKKEMRKEINDDLDAGSDNY